MFSEVENMSTKKRSNLYTPARQAANRRYDAKTYRRVTISLRLEDDADILESMDAAKSQGLSLREWLRKIMK